MSEDHNTWGERLNASLTPKRRRFSVLGILMWLATFALGFTMALVLAFNQPPVGCF